MAAINGLPLDEGQWIKGQVDIAGTKKILDVVLF